MPFILADSCAIVDALWVRKRYSGMEKTMKKLIALVLMGVVSLGILGCERQTAQPEPADVEVEVIEEPAM
jgi:hypothetical protein